MLAYALEHERMMAEARRAGIAAAKERDDLALLARMGVMRGQHAVRRRWNLGSTSNPSLATRDSTGPT